MPPSGRRNLVSSPRVAPSFLNPIIRNEFLPYYIQSIIKLITRLIITIGVIMTYRLQYLSIPFSKSPIPGHFCRFPRSFPHIVVIPPNKSISSSPMDSIPQHIVRDRFVGCLLITGRISIMLMIVCIPCSGIHSRIGQRLTGERMIRPAGEWKSVFHVLYEKILMRECSDRCRMYLLLGQIILSQPVRLQRQ